MIKKILIGLLLVFIAIQFVRPSKNTGNSESEKDIAHYVDVPEKVNEILKRSCYDCHSNNTYYPWYNQISPFSWVLSHHVDEGKSELNFSDFSKYNKKKMAHKLHEIADEVGEHKMPLLSYTVMHSGSKLSDAEVNIIVEWAKSEKKKLDGE